MYGHSFCYWAQAAFPNQVKNQKTIITSLSSESRPSYNVFCGDEIKKNEFSFVFLLIGINNHRLGQENFYITDRKIYLWFEISHGYISSKGRPTLLNDDNMYERIHFSAMKLDEGFMEHLDAYTNHYNRQIFTPMFRNHSSYRKL